MKISKNGLDLIKSFEGCRLSSYKCLPSEQYYTIGWGHYGPDVRLGQKITQEQADSMLEVDLISYENKVEYFNSTYNWTQNEFDALVSFCYNIGSINQLVNNGKRTKEEIADKMLLYVNSGPVKNVPGLVRRRKAERELFLSGSKSNNVNDNEIIAKPTIKKGVKSDEVKKLQQNLNKVLAGTTPLIIDGSCGSKTTAKIKLFQKKYGLDQDGSYGPKTYAKMCEVYR